MTDRSEERVVIAIGGNALSPAGGPAEIQTQFRHTRESLAPILEFARHGWGIAIVHGNGPQVGDALIRNERARSIVDQLPLGVLVAGTAGWIGYMIQQSLQNALAQEGIDRPVVTVINQVLVDREHPSTHEPRKFVGRTVDPEVGRQLIAEGVDLRPDRRGRLRRIVPSPEPLRILESDTVRELINRSTIVVACGGGGIPVYSDPALGLEGMDAVVDKDRAAAILAHDIGASLLLILTNVEGVYRSFGSPEQEIVPHMTPAEGWALLAEEDLGEGSMAPKLEAAIHFVEGGGERSVIAELGRGAAALHGSTGTMITSERPSTATTR